MRNAGFLLLILAALLFLTGFIPDRTEKVQFSFKGEDIVERISSDYPEIPVLSGREDIKKYLMDSNLAIELQFPKNIIQGRKGHVEVNAYLAGSEEADLLKPVPVDFSLQIKAHLDFPRQFVEPAGNYQKLISRQLSPAFHWNLLTTRKDTQKGTLWIYLTMQNPQELLLDYPLVARDLEIPVRTLLGMDLISSRIVGLCLAILGAALLVFGKFVRKN